jgi:hypothetical protein
VQSNQSVRLKTFLMRLEMKYSTSSFAKYSLGLIAMAMLSGHSTFLAAADLLVDLTVNCPVTSDSSSSDLGAGDYLHIDYRLLASGGTVDSVVLVKVDSRTGAETSTMLHGQSLRGGYPIGYCNPDQREYVPSMEKFELYSNCTGLPINDRILVRGHFSKATAGLLTISLYDTATGTMQNRKVETGICQ